VTESKKILFEKFEIIDCLKKDEFTSVYLANHIFLNKKIVLKVLDSGSIVDKSIIERFKREAKLLAQLDHPNIIKVLDFGMNDGSFYISFEFFESNNLRTIISKYSLSNNQIKQLLTQLLTGLSFAHSSKIIHRDIKPENIFVDEKFNLKIGDFGLAFSVGDKFVTQKASIVGTPAYMSPEQVQGQELDEKSDLFSVGVVAYELLTGNSLFVSDDLNSTINKILNFDSDELEFSDIDENEDLIMCIKELLHSEKQSRINSANEALQILGIVLDQSFHEKNQFKSPIRVHTKKVLILSFFLTLIIIAYFFSIINTPVSKQNENLSIDSSELNERDLETVQQIDTQKLENLAVSKNPIEENLESKELPNEPGNSPVRLEDENNTEPAEINSFGSLDLKVIPWAEVFLDSLRIDTTPIDSSITLTSGKHSLLLKNPGYPDYYTDIVIEPNKITELSYSFDTLFSYVKFDVFPWGSISIDNRIIGDTPISEPIILAEGSYEIIISNPEHGIVSKQIMTTRGDTLNVKHNYVGQK
jgi:serine/threonine protein kinase